MSTMNYKEQFIKKEKILKIVLIVLGIIIIFIWASIYFIQKSNLQNLLEEEKNHAIFNVKMIKNNIQDNIYSNQIIETLFLHKNEILINLALETNNIKKIESLRKLFNISQFFIADKYNKVQLSLPENAVLPIQLENLPKNEEVVLLESRSGWIYLATYQAQQWFIAGLEKQNLRNLLEPIELSSLFDKISKQIFNMSKSESKMNHIVYIVIQDNEGIIAATSNIEFLKSIDSDDFLKQVSQNQKPKSRIYDYSDSLQTQKIFEMVMPGGFYQNSNTLIRLGVSYHRIEQFQKKQNILLAIYSLIFISMLILELKFYRHYTRLNEIKREINLKRHLAEIGRLGGEVAHEIKNPLNAIYMTLQRLKSNYLSQTKETFDKSVTIIYTEIERLNNIIERFLSLSRPSKLSYTSNNVSNFLQEIKDLFAEDCKKNNIQCNLMFKEDVKWNFDREAIRKVIINLIKNSLEAFSKEIEQDKKIIEIGFVIENKNLRISIADNGMGMSPKIQEEIWNFYFTTKSEGNGIGLPTVKKIIEEHLGMINIESKLDKGTTVYIYLPKMRIK